MFKKIIEKLYLRQEGNLAYYDSLTGVKNRQYYDLEVKPKYCTKECFILYIDVDGLKKVNDNMGHAKGDEYIVSVSEQLKFLTDVKEVCRVGGDEFIVILGDKFKYEQFPTIRNASYGFVKKGKFEDVSSAVRKADDQMYRTKRIRKQNKNVIGFRKEAEEVKEKELCLN